MVSEIQFKKIQTFIKLYVEEGATLIAGGLGRPEELVMGHFVRTTIFADVTPEMTIWKEEIFGLVLCIMPFYSDDEAIAIANDTPYGLANCVQTADTKRAQRITRRLSSSMIKINYKFVGAGLPFGSMKQSVNGWEGGHWGLKEFLEVKAVSDWG